MIAYWLFIFLIVNNSISNNEGIYSIYFHASCVWIQLLSLLSKEFLTKTLFNFSFNLCIEIITTIKSTFTYTCYTIRNYNTFKRCTNEEKARSPILITLLGIVILLREPQKEKA
mgnify:CR=1 FL=1